MLNDRKTVVRLPNGRAVPIFWRDPLGMVTGIHDDATTEFMLACHREKERVRRMLTPAEILRVATRLGYRKVIDVRQAKTQLARDGN